MIVFAGTADSALLGEFGAIANITPIYFANVVVDLDLPWIESIAASPFCRQRSNNLGLS